MTKLMIFLDFQTISEASNSSMSKGRSASLTRPSGSEVEFKDSASQAASGRYLGTVPTVPTTYRTYPLIRFLSRKKIGSKGCGSGTFLIGSGSSKSEFEKSDPDLTYN